MKKLYEHIIIFCIGAICYSSIEILWRGFTHWTMILTGGIVLLALYILNTRLINGSLFKRCIIGCFTITVIEFIVGYIVNIICKMNVWNYSGQPMHFLGQVCPLFTFFWFLLCIPATLLCMFIYEKVFGYKKTSKKNIVVKSKRL